MTVLNKTTKHIQPLRVNSRKLGDHHILSRVEKDKFGNITEQEIVMWGGHDVKEAT